MFYAIHSDESLRTHLRRGGNISAGDDGYDQMDRLDKAGWKVIPSWGLNGWDLGDWPYVAVYIHRDDASRFRVVVEGDVEDYVGFTDAADRDAGISRTFVWYAKHGDESWAASWDEADPPQEARGPFSWARLDEAQAVAR